MMKNSKANRGRNLKLLLLLLKEMMKKMRTWNLMMKNPTHPIRMEEMMMTMTTMDPLCFLARTYLRLLNLKEPREALKGELLKAHNLRGSNHP